MSMRLRRLAPVLTAALVAVTTLTTAAPTQALEVLDWPAGGYVPVGCSNTGFSSGGPTGFQTSYVDSLQPTVVDTAVSGGGSVVLKAGPAATPYTVDVAATETCSGVKSVMVAWLRVQTAGYQSMNLGPISPDPIHAKFQGANFARSDEAGVYRVGVAVVGRRWDTFVLDANYQLSSVVAPATGTVFTTGPWSLKNLYLLRQTTITIAAPTSVKKGKLATISGVLKYATNAGLVADNGEKVLVQTRVGKGAWKSVVVVTANAAGAWSAKVKLTTTGQVRVVHTAVLSGRFTAGVVSTVKTVKVA